MALRKDTERFTVSENALMDLPTTAPDRFQIRKAFFSYTVYCGVYSGTISLSLSLIAVVLNVSAIWINSSI